MPQRIIAAEYGYTEAANSTVSAIVLAVLYYLDDSIEVGDTSKRRAEYMRRTVARLRPYVRSVEARQRLCEEIGVSRLAERFPLARAETLRALVAALRSGGMRSLEQQHPRHYEALVLRFGLNDLDVGVYRKLSEVGELMGGITRERVRQLEEAGLEFLGVRETEDASS